MSYSNVSPGLRRWLSEPVYDLMQRDADRYEQQLLQALISHTMSSDLPDGMFSGLRTPDRAVFFHTVKEILYQVLTQAEWVEYVEVSPSYSAPMVYDDLSDTLFKRSIKQRVFDAILRDSTPREKEAVRMLDDLMDRMPKNSEEVRILYTGLRLLKLPLEQKDHNLLLFLYRQSAIVSSVIGG